MVHFWLIYIFSSCITAKNTIEDPLHSVYLANDLVKFGNLSALLKRNRGFISCFSFLLFYVTVETASELLLCLASTFSFVYDVYYYRWRHGKNRTRHQIAELCSPAHYRQHHTKQFRNFNNKQQQTTNNSNNTANIKGKSG